MSNKIKNVNNLLNRTELEIMANGEWVVEVALMFTKKMQ